MVQDHTIPGIDKTKLKGKYVEFFDRQGKQRCHKVIRLTGRSITVKDALGKKTRIHPDKQRVLGVYYRKKLVEILW